MRHDVNSHEPPRMHRSAGVMNVHDDDIIIFSERLLCVVYGAYIGTKI